MAGDWIKIELATPDKPEVVAMAADLRKDQDAVFGKLFRVWAWADTNAIDGSAVGVTEAFIDRLTACRGFAKAMRTQHWLSGKDGALIFPNFDRHNGKTAKARAMDNRKKAAQRERDKLANLVPFSSGQEPPESPDNNGTFPGTNTGTREDIKKKKKEKAPHGAADPQTPIPDLQALRLRWADLDIDEQLGAASRWCLTQYGRPDFQAKWFEETWLTNARTRLRGTVAAATSATTGSGAKPEPDRGPEGWSVWLDDNCPGSVYARGRAMEGREWHELDRSTRDFIAAGMAKPKREGSA